MPGSTSSDPVLGPDSLPSKPSAASENVSMAPPPLPQPTPAAMQAPSTATAAHAAPAAPAVLPAPEIAKPYCFFPVNNNPLRSSDNEPEPIPDDVFVHPDDDPTASRGIPVFRPSYEEFKDFAAYQEKVRPWGEKSGIVKIIPPKEWVDSVKLIDKYEMSRLPIRSPIEQDMAGSNGVFVQCNIERNSTRPLSIHEWFDKCRKEFPTPNPKEGRRSTARDSKEAKERAAQAVAEKKAKRIANRVQREKLAERKALATSQTAEAKATTTGETAVAGPSRAHPVTASHSTEDDDVPGLDTSSNTSHSSGEPLATTPEPIQDLDAESYVDPFYENVDLRKAWLPEGISPEDFTVEGCLNIEKKFWSAIGSSSKSSWYGADLPGSLFADPSTPWNVAHLPNLLRKLPNKLPGVNSPYLYFGMWRAAFSWHVEDMDLYSINYIHFGAPKFWYAVPQADAGRLESVARSFFPTAANGCPQFMRHKACTISPSMLHKHGIRVNKLVHHQNEFVITYPHGYHAGFNLGFNCAESTNFALPAWLELGRKAKACSCVDFSVRIDVDLLMQPTPSPEPSSPSPPRHRQRGRKRKAESTPEGSTPRRRKAVDRTDEDTPSPAKPAARIRKPAEIISLASKEPPHSSVTREAPTHCCVLCPSEATEDLAPVFQPSDFIRGLSKTPAVQAHVSCAIAVPEAFTDEVDIDGQMVTYIKGLDDIGKDRWNLKCACCSDKRAAKMGTKIQCTKGKCVRAYHVSCARNNEEIAYSAETRMEQRPVASPEGAPLSTEFEQVPVFVVELLCPTHNPAMVEIKKRRAQEELRKKVLALNEGDIIKVKRGGGVFEARLLNVNDESQKVTVESDVGVIQMAWSAIDFRPNAAQLLENEYARPPKRSRKPQDLPPLFIPSMASQGGPVMYAPPQHMAPYHDPGQAAAMYHAAHSVRLVDSRFEPPFDHYAGGYGAMLPRGRGFAPLAHASRVVGHSGGMVPYGRPTGFADQRAAASGSSRPPIQGWAPPPTQGQGSSQGPSRGQMPSMNGTSGGVGKIDLGLDRMFHLVAALPPFAVPAIHLAGTNGKGSVSAILESCLKVAGLRTMRYNSPHLLEPRDAVRIDGEPPSAEAYGQAIAQVQHISDARSLGATTFEIATAAAFLLANTAQPPIDVMIIECGMGGARDATNVIPPRLVLASGLTSVGLDHTDRLGSTIAAIAREKASIVVPGSVLVVAPNLQPDAVTTAYQVASQRDAHVVQAAISKVARPQGPLSLQPFQEPEPALIRTPLRGGSHVIESHLRLGGAHQLDNLSLALTLLDVMVNDKRATTIQPKLRQLTDAGIARGVAETQWAGRCSWLQVDIGRDTPIPVLLDGAHNADSAATLRRYIDSLGEAAARRTFVISLSGSPGKTPASVLTPLLRPGDRVALAHFTTPVEGMPWIREADAAAVRAAVEAAVGPSGAIYDAQGMGPTSVRDALRWAADGWDADPALVTVCGSLYLVADVYRLTQGVGGVTGGRVENGT